MSLGPMCGVHCTRVRHGNGPTMDRHCGCEMCHDTSSAETITAQTGGLTLSAGWGSAGPAEGATIASEGTADAAALDEARQSAEEEAVEELHRDLDDL